MGWLSPDSKFMQAVSNLTDAIWINILTLVTSLPVITIGAALSAAHDATRRSLAGQGHVTANYFHAFKVNFVKASLLWAIVGPIALALGATWIFLQFTPLLIPKFGLSILWLIGFEWMFALQARFENTVGRTFKNAFIFGVANIGWTVFMIAVDVAFMVILWACYTYVPQALFLPLIMGYGSMISLHTPILEHVFRPYIEHSEPLTKPAR